MGRCELESGLRWMVVCIGDEAQRTQICGGRAVQDRGEIEEESSVTLKERWRCADYGQLFDAAHVLNMNHSQLLV